MSDHDYTPDSKLGKWFNDRLPLLNSFKSFNNIQHQKI